MIRVVIVEGDERLRRRLALSVDWTGLNCALAGQAGGSGEGLALIRRERPDLVIAGTELPGPDGPELLRRLRESGDGVPVILLAPRRDFDCARAALRLGAADLLVMPLGKGELEEAVGRLLRRPRLNIPDLPAGSHSRYVTEALRYIDGHYGQTDLTVSSIARALDVSEGHLSHLFKKETGRTVNNQLTSRRVNAAMELLKDYHSKVYEVAQQVGYRDTAYFSGTFKRVVGVSPSEYQKQCK